MILKITDEESSTLSYLQAGYVGLQNLIAVLDKDNPNLEFLLTKYQAAFQAWDDYRDKLRVKYVPKEYQNENYNFEINFASNTLTIYEKH